MHTITPAIRKRAQTMHADQATVAGVLSIYEHVGQLRWPAELRVLSDQERQWFHQAFEHYHGTPDHPLRAVHAPRHYGRVIYYLSLLYYLSLITWLAALINYSVETGKHINWAAVWTWIIMVSLFNLALTWYGIHLETQAYKQRLMTIHRVMATLAIVALMVGIIGNVLAPYASADENTTTRLFIQN